MTLRRPLVAATLAALTALSSARAQEMEPRVLAQGTGYAFFAAPTGDGVYALREEVTSSALVQTLGGRSATAELTVDCAHRQSALGSIRVYAGSGATGEATTMKAAAWMRAAPVDLFDLTEALCAGGAPAAAPPRLAAPAAVSAPSIAEPSSAPSAAAPPPVVAGAHWVQVGAFASVEVAEGEWSKLKAAGMFGAPERRIEAVNRGGATLQRLLVGPYTSKVAAQSACAAATKAGVACIVR